MAFLTCQFSEATVPVMQPNTTLGVAVKLQMRLKPLISGFKEDYPGLSGWAGLDVLEGLNVGPSFPQEREAVLPVTDSFGQCLWRSTVLVTPPLGILSPIPYNKSLSRKMDR